MRCFSACHPPYLCRYGIVWPSKGKVTNGKSGSFLQENMNKICWDAFSMDVSSFTNLYTLSTCVITSTGHVPTTQTKHAKNTRHHITPSATSTNTRAMIPFVCFLCMYMYMQMYMSVSVWVHEMCACVCVCSLYVHILKNDHTYTHTDPDKETDACVYINWMFKCTVTCTYIQTLIHT